MGKSLGDTPQKLCVPLLRRRSRHLALLAEAGAMFVSALLFFLSPFHSLSPLPL